MTSFRAPSPPYVGPAYRKSSGSNKPIRRIVMHSTVSPCTPGMARQIGAYFRSSRAGGSAHYIVDPKEVVQSVHDSVIAWHAPPNGNSLGIEMCDNPTTASTARWEGDSTDARNHQAMLELAADLVADLCLAYDVPPWYRGSLALRAGLRGITEHDEVSKAFGQSSHWDCGAWPRQKFMRRVRALIKQKKAAAAANSKKGSNR